jgi:orotate phosphoribosyltransferase
LDEIQKRIGSQEFGMLKIGGLETGAIPIIMSIINAHQMNRFYVRKQPKKYGMKQQIEGSLENTDKVILVDDIVTSGKSILQCIDVLKKAHHRIKVIGVYPVIDRNKELENYDLFFQLQSREIEYKPIFSSLDFIYPREEQISIVEKNEQTRT